MHDFGSITRDELAELGDSLRVQASAAESMEAAAGNMVRHLYDNLGDEKTGETSCALVRFYKTHPFGELDAGLQGFARGVLGDKPASADVSCLTLLATVGDQPAWNSRAQSNGHKAIPLASEEAMAQIPMVAQLVRQFGLKASYVVKPAPGAAADLEQRMYNAFYIPEASGSPYIPAQDEFVIPFGIQSVLGFGGVLRAGELFAIIMFSKTSIPQQAADLFRDLGPSVKAAVEPFVGGAVFA